MNSKGKKPENVWDFCPVRNQIENSSYPTQKPESLLERIIKASSNEGDVVADFFCGSGTTPAVAKRLNRQYFACDISERAIEITRKRLECVEPERQQDLFTIDAGTGDNKKMVRTSNTPRQVSLC